MRNPILSSKRSVYRLGVGVDRTTWTRLVDPSDPRDFEGSLESGSTRTLLLDRFRRRVRYPRTVLLVAAAAIAMALAGQMLGASLWEALLLWSLAGAVAFLADDVDRGNDVVLLYDFEPGDAGRTYQRVLDAFRGAMSCSRKEFVREGPLEGDFQAISATSVTLGLSCQAPAIETNLAMPVLLSAWRSIYLLPDCLLTFDVNRQGAALVPYGELIVESGRSAVVEASPPDDAAVVSSNGSSGLSVAVYDWVRLRTSGNDIALMQLSKAGSGAAFVEALHAAGARRAIA